MSKYRLTPKPGLIRAGRFVQTKVNPKIVIQKPGNVAQIKIPKIKTPQVKKVKFGQVKETIQISPQVSKPPVKHTPRSRSTISAHKQKNVAIDRRPNPKRNKVSQVRNNRDRAQAKYVDAIQELQDIGVGRILIIVACGPSVSEVDFTPVLQHPMVDFMNINKPYDPIFEHVRWWVFCDQSQYLRNKVAFEGHRGSIINAWSVRARHPQQILIRNKPGRGFSKNLLQGYHIGRSTTYANMQVAYWMNYDKVYVFGCDMDPKASEKFGQLHHYGTNPDVDPKIRVKRFEQEASHYLNGANSLSPSEKQKFVFCSAYNPWPFMKQFPNLDHRVAVDSILKTAETAKIVKDKLEQKP